jgi:uncharacterized protein (TIGR02996 family)
VVDEAAFLSAIREGDDVARLAFADWLEERGDVRAAWVRDAEIFAWMGPDAADPLAAMLEAAATEESDRSRPAHLALRRLGVAVVPRLLAAVEAGQAQGLAAGEALGEMSREAVEPILPRLLELANADRLDVRWPALIALKAVGPAAAPALPAILPLVNGNTEDAEYRKRAWQLVHVLGAIGQAALPAVPGLLRLQNRIYPGVVNGVLVAIGPAAVPVVLAEVESLHEAVYLTFARPLAELAPECLPVLREAALSGTPRARQVASLALAKLDPVAALPGLLDGLEALAGTNEDHYIADAIRDIAAVVRPPVERLQRLLPVLSPHGRWPIAECLNNLGEGGGTLEAIREQLRDPVPARRAGAVHALRALDAPEVTLPLAAAMLGDPDADVRQETRFMLDAIAESDPEAITPALHDAIRFAHPDGLEWAMNELAKRMPRRDALFHDWLRDDRPTVRARAIPFLQGPDAAELAPEFVRLAHDPDKGVRAAAVSALGETGPLTPDVIDRIRSALASPSAILRRAALRAVALRGPVEIGVAAEAVQLAEQDGDDLVRQSAVDVLPFCGLPLADLAALLHRGLQDGYHGVRAAAAHLLGDVAEQDRSLVEPAVPTLFTLCLAVDGWDTAGAAMRALVAVGPAAVPFLTQVLSPDTAGGKRCACAALGRIGPPASSAASAIASMLSSSNEFTRQEALIALTATGTASDYLPAIRALTRWQRWCVIQAALVALVRTGATDAWTDVVPLLDEHEHAGLVASMAVWALSRLGPPEATRPLLVTRARAENDGVRAVARLELWRVGAGTEPTVDELLHTEHLPGVREEVLALLSQRAERDRASFDSILAATDSQNSRLAHEVLAAVSHVDPEAAGRSFRASLGEPYRHSPCEEVALRGLLALGPEASLPALPRLHELCSAPHPQRRSAALALVRRMVRLFNP